MGQEEVKKELKKKGSWLMSNEIAKSTGNSLKSIQSSLRRLVKWGEVKKEPATKVIQDKSRLKDKSFAGYAYKVKQFKTLDDFKFDDKNVLLRLDLNSKLIPEFEPSEHFSHHLPTILELSEKKAKVLILTHQDFKDKKQSESLQAHADYLSKKLNQKVVYLDDISKNIENLIKVLDPGKVIILKNLASIKEEKITKINKQKKTKLIQELSKIADIYVNDSFSLSHLSNLSLTGFPQVMPSCIGRYFEKEIEIASHIFLPSKPCLFLLGGKKPDQLIPLIKTSLEEKRVNTVLTSGLLATAFHVAKGQKLGGQEAELKKNKIKVSSDFKNLINTYENIILPNDYLISTLGVNETVEISNLPVAQTIDDIGPKTLENYLDLIKNSKTIFVKGITSKIDNSESVRKILNEIADSEAFTFVVGKSTVDLFKKHNIPIQKITHLSKDSLPLITYLSTGQLPSLEVLKMK